MLNKLKNTIWTKVSKLKVGDKIAVTDTQVPNQKIGKGSKPIQFDEIVSIKKLGKQKVMDIEIDGTRNFVGNGIIAHNTIANIYYDTADANYFLDPASSGDSLIVAGNVGIGYTDPGAAIHLAGSAKIKFAGAGEIESTSNANIVLDAGSGTVVIGDGTGKFDSGTIDPPYTINGDKYATYMAAMIGIKEETTGVVHTTDQIPGVGYKHTLDFKSQPQGSDLWLFAKTTDLKKQIEDLVVLLSPAGKTRAWYTLDTRNYELNIFTSEPSLVSYRLTAPRFDADIWLNTREEHESTGFVLDDPDEWQENVAGTVIGSTSAISEIFNQLEASYVKVRNLDIAETITLQGVSLQAYITKAVEDILADRPDFLSPTTEAERLTTNFISPLADNGEIVIESNLKVEGDLQAETITTDTLTATEVTTTDLTTQTLVANQIKSSTIDTIRDRVADLAEEYATSTATASAEIDALSRELANTILSDQLSATDSANLDIASINADFGFFSDYLAVMGLTVTTDLKVNNTLTGLTTWSSAHQASLHFPANWTCSPA